MSVKVIDFNSFVYHIFKKKILSGPSSSQKAGSAQIGEGSSLQNKKQKNFHKLFKLTNESDDDDSESDEVFDVIAKKVVQKLTNTPPATNLWHSSSTPVTATLATPVTEPPLPFAIKIKKDDENDVFGIINNFHFFVRNLIDI